MPFAEGTSVTFPVESGETNIGTVKEFQNGKYHVEVEGGEIVEVDEAKVSKFEILMTNRGIFETLK